MVIGIGNTARRATSMLRSVGPAGFARRAFLWGARRIGWMPAGEAAWHRRQREADAAFDAAHGVATGGVVSLDRLTITGANGPLGMPYVPSHPDEVQAVFADLAPDPAARDFVDLGSGKGRVLILAAQAGFRTVTGVEFAAELHAAAEDNIAALPADARARIRLVHGDAAAFDFPAGALVVFLFNPFGEAVSRAVARRLMTDWRARPRPIEVVYLNPLQADAWRAEGWVEAGRGQGYLRLAPSAAQS